MPVYSVRPRLIVYRSVSFLIPFELLPIISSHIALIEDASASSPIIFDVPQAFQLHRLVSIPLPPPSIPSPTRVAGCNLKWCPIALHQHGPARPFTHSPLDTHIRNLPQSFTATGTNGKRQAGLVNYFWNQKIVRTGKAVISGTTNYSGFRIPMSLSMPKPKHSSGSNLACAISFASKDARNSIGADVNSGEVQADVMLPEGTLLAFSNGASQPISFESSFKEKSSIDGRL